MPITFSESSSDEAAPAAQAHAVLKAGLAARGAAPKKNKAAAPAAHAGKSTSKLTSSKTVGAKRGGRERSRLNLLSDGSSDDADELDLSDDDESEKIAAALKQMAEQMHSKRKRKAEELKRRLEKEYAEQVKEAVAEAASIIQSAKDEFTTDFKKEFKKLKAEQKELDKAEKLFWTQQADFEKEVAAHSKFIEARVLAAQENEATGAEAYKTILEAHRRKADQIVEQTKSKVQKVASMTPDMRGVVEALATAVQNFEQGMSKVAGESNA